MLLCAFTLREQHSFLQLYALTGGTWEMKTKKGAICERWQMINDNEIHGQGFKVIGHDTTLLEQVRLIRKNNEVYYIPTVSNQNGGQAVSFKLTEVKGRQFTFSNPAHDYPQFVVYDILSPDSLHAWTDGKNNGKALKVDFYYRRVR